MPVISLSKIRDSFPRKRNHICGGCVGRHRERAADIRRLFACASHKCTQVVLYVHCDYGECCPPDESVSRGTLCIETFF